MDPQPVVFDISSDEEGGLNDGNDDDVDWLSELLDTFDNKTEESDEVEIVGEVSCNSVTQKQSYKLSEAVRSTYKDDLDDECLILDGDPDNPVPIVNDKADESDELLIVGEKGQLACRDYPHPRHLCAKFPFSSTPHEKYCVLCHCYVCDSLAPCIHWGTGVSNTDHCHSTDKEEVWRMKRKVEQHKETPLPFKKLPDIALPWTQPLPNPVPTVTRMDPLNRHSVPIHSVSNSTPLRPCPSRTSFGVPNIMSHSNNQRAAHISGRIRYQQPVSRLQQPMPSTNITLRERGVSGSASHPQFVSPHVNFSRVGGAVRMSKPRYSPYNNNNRIQISQSPRDHHPQVIPSDNNHTRWQDFLSDMDADLGAYQSTSQPITGSKYADFQPYTASSEPEVYSQPIPQPNVIQDNYLHGNPTLNATIPSSSDFDSSWISSTTQSIAQHTQVEVSQLQSLQTTTDLSTVAMPDPQYSWSKNLGSPDFHLESWIPLEHQPVPGAAKDPLPSEQDFVSPQPASVDPSMRFFDFEASWM